MQLSLFLMCVASCLHKQKLVQHVQERIVHKPFLSNYRKSIASLQTMGEKIHNVGVNEKTMKVLMNETLLIVFTLNFHSAKMICDQVERKYLDWIATRNKKHCCCFFVVWICRHNTQTNPRKLTILKLFSHIPHVNKSQKDMKKATGWEEGRNSRYWFHIMSKKLMFRIDEAECEDSPKVIMKILCRLARFTNSQWASWERVQFK